MINKSDKTHKENYVLEIGNKGRIVLPSELRRRLGLKEGDRILLSVEGDGSAMLVSVKSQVEGARGMLKELAPERNVVDEFIAERRAEAERE
jgi:AbrB family looped-hinge helix DNA binding protein